MTTIQRQHAADGQSGRITIAHDGARNDDGSPGGCRLAVSFPAVDTNAVAASKLCRGFGDFATFVAALVVRNANRVHVRFRSNAAYYAGQAGQGPDLIYIARSRHEARAIYRSCSHDNTIFVRLYTDEAQLHAG